MRRIGPGGLAGVGRGLLMGAALAAAGPAGSLGPPAPAATASERAPAPPVQDWRAEFADVCSRTQDAMSLGDAELRTLVERCDRLKPAVEGLDEPERKVFRRRLEVCRNLYQFVLDARAAGSAK